MKKTRRHESRHRSPIRSSLTYYNGASCETDQNNVLEFQQPFADKAAVTILGDTLPSFSAARRRMLVVW